MKTYRENRQEDTRKKAETILKYGSFGMLLLVTMTIFLAILLNGIMGGSALTMKIYYLNSAFCVASLALQIAFLVVHFRGQKAKEILLKIKKFFKQEWPCLLLVIFMAWTAVGCIEAGMEAGAEAQIREALKEYEAGTRTTFDDLKSAVSIAAWSKGERATNAADRAWNGCNNLKDGYFSFLFYATIVTNVMLLGYGKKHWKKWLLRVMMAGMLLIVFLTFLNLCNSEVLPWLPYQRAIFHNSNHYGYYLCLAVILGATIWMKEKNWYWKGIGLITYLFSTYMLVINNTFGSYLGILVAVACMTLFAVLDWWRHRKETEKKSYLEILKVIPLVLFLVICSATLYCGPNNVILQVLANKGETVTCYCYPLGRALVLPKDTMPSHSIVVTNFQNTLQDLGIWMNYAETTDDTDSQGEVETETNTSLQDAIAHTGSGRGEVWLGVFHLIQQKPIFGWGLENLLQAFYDQLGINEGRTHNLILQLMGTTGIPGMAFYMIALLIIFWRRLRRWKQWNALEYITFFCFISYMVSSMFGNSAFYTSPYFMVILGIMITADWEEERYE